MARRGIAVVLVLGCSPFEREDPHLRIIDQSGAEFFWACTTERCEVHRIAGVSPLPDCFPGEEASFSIGLGRFFSVWDHCLEDSGQWFIGEDRFVVCNDEAECPQVSDIAAYECRAGFCQNLDTEQYPVGLPSPTYLVRLCTGHVPRGEDDSPTPELAAAITAACPSEDQQAPCESIPPACPDPR